MQDAIHASRSPNRDATSAAMRLDRLLGIVTVGAKPERCPVFGGEHHDPHDTLAVHFHVVAPDGDLGAELRGRLDDLGRGPGMQPVPVLDAHFFFAHHRIAE